MIGSKDMTNHPQLGKGSDTLSGQSAPNARWRTWWTNTRRPFVIYLWGVSLIGLSIAVWALMLLPTYQPLTTFVLLLLLACLAQTTTTTVDVAGKTGITFEVGTAVAMAAIPLFGPPAAALIGAASALFLWLVKRKDRAVWKRSWRQLAFNNGMWSVAALAAGWSFFALQRWLNADLWLSMMLVWVITAIVYDQVNFWLLMVVIRLQQGDSVRVGQIWAENLWAVAINVIVLSLGGALLAFAIARYDWLGVVIFFLPIFLSAFAFRIYVSQTRQHLVQLEQLVAERTADLLLANTQLAQKNQDLETFSQEKDRFLAILSHEMNSPLTAIGLYADMISQRLDLTSERRMQMASVIKMNQQTLSEIVENILELEGLRAGQRLVPKREHLSISGLLATTVRAVEAQADHKGILIDVAVDQKADLLVLADREYVRRIILNLLSNAIKYSPEGSRISTGIGDRGDHVEIVIKDTGFGIPAGDLPYIFEPFKRVDKHMGRAHGTGLGLAIVKQYVDALEGTIMVESQEGVGSTFTVSLPLMTDA